MTAGLSFFCVPVYCNHFVVTERIGRKDYSATLSYPVKFVNPPKELFLCKFTPSRRPEGSCTDLHSCATSSLFFVTLLIDLSEISRNNENLLSEINISSNVLIKNRYTNQQGDFH